MKCLCLETLYLVSPNFVYKKFRNMKKNLATLLLILLFVACKSTLQHKAVIYTITNIEPLTSQEGAVGFLLGQIPFVVKLENDTFIFRNQADVNIDTFPKKEFRIVDSNEYGMLIELNSKKFTLTKQVD